MSNPNKSGMTPPSLLKRVCGAVGCEKEMRGNDLPRHYQQKTNFELLTRLYSLSSEAAEEMVKTVDSHTAFMFTNKYSASKLPKYSTHKLAKMKVPEWAKPKRDTDNDSNDSNK